MFNVGIITFHASYNFGTVMQAWSTQKVVLSLGYQSEIINFRMYSQKDKYSIFPLKSGIKTILRNLIQIRYIKQKHKSNKKYEDFITAKLYLTEEYNTIEELRKVKKFDIYLAGSDQIWGYSIPEFVNEKVDVRGAYYFNFIDGYKISYASSTGMATFQQLLRYKSDMDKFQCIAVREEQGKKIIEKITKKDVCVVLDPTFLITHKEWKEIAQKQKRVCDEKYILIYSLQGIKKAKKWKKLIEILREKEQIKFVTICPFAPITGKGIYNYISAGPKEILNLFAYAQYIFTDTFHGMSFSIHFRKPFTVFEDTEADFRKKNLLQMFQMEDRETNKMDRCLEQYSFGLEYSGIEQRIDKKIKESQLYLKNALNAYKDIR